VAENTASVVGVVRGALAGTGIELVASCAVEAYDARAPEGYRSPSLLPGARGLVVVASAGTALWRRFRAHMDAEPSRWDQAHPYDAFVAMQLARADEALAAAGVRFRRFEAAFHAPLRVDFLALAQLVGLGAPGPFALLIHPEHGAWWALRGAWLLAAPVDPPRPYRSPCMSCAAPCVGGASGAGEGEPRGIPRATPEVRGRCVVGQASRYDDDQIGYHYDRANTVARLRRGSGSGSGSGSEEP
jgi:hypothetical protein